MTQFDRKPSQVTSERRDHRSVGGLGRISVIMSCILLALMVTAACVGVNDNGTQEDALEAREARRNAPPPTSGSPGVPGSPGIDSGNIAAVGQQLYQTLGCVGCHSLDGSDGVGPTWEGIVGRETPLEDGSTVTADEVYITQSIREPQAQIHEGYEVPMPSYAQLTDEEIQSIIAFMETLQ